MSPVVALDTETTLIADQGKVPTYHDVPDLVCTSWCSTAPLPGYASAGVVEGVGASTALLDAVLAYAEIIVFHNSAFDIAVLCKACERGGSLRRAIRDRRIRDTLPMFAFRCLDPDRRLTLQYAVRKALGHYLPKSDVRTSFRPGVPLSEEQRDYALQDAVYTLALYQALEATPSGGLTDQGRHAGLVEIQPLVPEETTGHDLDALYSAASAWKAFTLEATGIGVHVPTLRELAAEQEAVVSGVRNRLLELGLATYVKREKSKCRPVGETPELYGVTLWADRAYRVSAHTPVGPVVSRLYKGEVQWAPARFKLLTKRITELYEQAGKDLGLDDVPRTPTGAVSLNYQYWRQHKAALPRGCAEHAAYAGATKLLGTYFRPLLAKVNATTEHLTVHGSYGIGYAETGRWTSWKPNLQNQPKKIRKMYTSPTPGHVLVSADYKSLELYTLCQSMHSLGIKGPLFDLLESQVDVHRRAASMIFEVPEEQVTKEQRQGAKACFHPDVEILTRQGWTKVSELSEDVEVANYWPVAEEVTWEKPLRLTSREDRPLLRLRGKNIDMRVTPDHRMLYGTNGAARVCLAKDFLPGKVSVAWHAGSASGLRYGAVDARAVRQAVAVQADGSFAGRRVRFGFSKQRKVDRLRELWPQAGQADYGERVAFSVPRAGPWTLLLDGEKRFRCDVLLGLPSALREVFLEELRHWDGRFDRGACTADHWFGTSEEDAKTIQAVASVTGRKTRATVVAPRRPLYKPVWTVRISARAHSSKPRFAVEALPPQKVHCLTTHSGYVIARDGGIPLVLGQCNFGLPGGMGVRRFRETARNQYRLDWTPDHAARMRERWFEVFPDVAEFLRLFKLNPYNLCPWNLPHRIWLEQLGYTIQGADDYPNAFDLSRTINDGRVYDITLPSGRRLPNRRYSQAANAYMQGPGGEIVTKAFASLADHGWDIVSVVHDSLTLTCAPANASRAAAALRQHMLEAQAAFCPALASFLSEPEVDVSERWS